MMSKKGFTLLEVIVASVLLILIVAGLVGVFVTGRKLIIHNRSRLAAVELFRYYLAPLQMDVREDFWGTNCVSGNNPALCSSGNITLDNKTYTPTYQLGYITPTSVPIVQRVTLNMSWSE